MIVAAWGKAAAPRSVIVQQFSIESVKTCENNSGFSDLKIFAAPRMASICFIALGGGISLPSGKEVIVFVGMAHLASVAGDGDKKKKEKKKAGPSHLHCSWSG